MTDYVRQLSVCLPKCQEFLNISLLTYLGQAIPSTLHEMMTALFNNRLKKWHWINSHIYNWQIIIRDNSRNLPKF